MPAITKTPKLLDQLHTAVEVRHLSKKTEQAYAHWIKRFCQFNNMRHPMELGEIEINTFLSHLALQESVSASTQNQALAALLFLYKNVLKKTNW